ncbi:hypothetical protein [Shewanella algae]|uniref:hypothetical protein n=1 Tax=Shewanella algae TaxID=38313 RepID=UPI0034D70AD2
MNDSEIDIEIAFWDEQKKTTNNDLVDKANAEIAALNRIKDQNKKDREQLFIILWIFLGVVLTALLENSPILAWVIAVVSAGVYSQLFYKK